MDVLRYETAPAEFDEHPAPYIFLAGPTVRGHQQHLQPSWRFAAIDRFEDKKFTGTLIVPEFEDVSISDKGKEDLPLWEYAGLSMADCIMFWIPRTRELIGLTSNFEFGYWLRARDKVVYGRPDDAYRMGYVDTLWQKDYSAHGGEGCKTIYNTLNQTVDAALETVNA